jgi:hypothetical protein
MPKRSLRSLSGLTVLVALAVLIPAAGRAGKGPVPQFLSASFKQVNWLEAPGAPLQANSIWSTFEFGYRPVAKTWYLNGAVKLPGGRNEHWFLRNLPLFGERNPRLRREAVFLDLRRLGLADRTDLKSVQAVFSLDNAPRKNSPPVASGSVIPVGDRDLLLDDALGLNKLEPFIPGGPRTIVISQAPKQDVATRLTNRVQERRGQGMAGSFARGLDRLNQIFQWNPTLSSQTIYEDLVRDGVSTAGDLNGNGTSIDEWVEAKDDYAFRLSGGDTATTVWDSANLFPPIPAIREEKGDFVKWLKAEMAKEGNVQVLVSFSGGRYAFILTGMFSEKGKTYVRFRFDDKPGDDLKGDEEDLVGEVFKGAGGAYFLLSDAWKIIGGVSESVAKR